MSIFTELAFERKLAELNPSANSIQNLSAWLIHHRKHHETVVKIWYKEFLQAQEHRKLTFVYLANDVIQNSRKRFPEYGKTFAPVFKKVLEQMAKISGEKTKNSIGRILNIWEERCIYDSKLIKEFKTLYEKAWDDLHDEEFDFQSFDALSPKDEPEDDDNNLSPDPEDITGSPKAKKTQESDLAGKNRNRRHSSHSDSHSDSHEHRRKRVRTKKEQIDSQLRKRQMESTHRSIDEIEAEGIKVVEVKLCPSNVPLDKFPTEEELIQMIKDLERMPSTDGVTRGRIANLPPEVSELSRIDEICTDSDVIKSLRKEIYAAAELVVDYERKLDLELEDREKASRKLQSFHHLQKDLLNQSESRLEEHQAHLKVMYAKLEELKNHVSKMPDFSKLPTITDGLAPLPTVNELF